MLATKPEKSPVIPPPTPIIKSVLLKLLNNNLSKENFINIDTTEDTPEESLKKIIDEI